jgi:mitogen-activated protein kinase 1/3
MKEGGRDVATPAKAGSPKKESEKEKRPSSIALAPPLPPHLSLARDTPLGKGAYGDVWLCNDSKSNEQVAVKWIKDFARDSLFGKRILREIRILAALKHQNLLKLTDLLPPASADFEDVFIVMPYMHLDLSRVIYSAMQLSESHAQAFACQILRGLKYLHSAGVVHRDLKPANILVNKDCTLRIADLGLARGRTSEEEVLTEYVVTRWYRAPELMLLPSGYFEAVDLWSVGCIHAELLTRKPLFPGEHAVDMLRRIARTLGFSPETDLSWLPVDAKEKELEGVMNLVEEMKYEVVQPLETILPNASEVCLDFITQLLAFDHTKRISAADALYHPYIAGLRDKVWETVASTQFSWDFDRFEPTRSALKDRVYLEIARLHPDILARDAAQLVKTGRGHLLQGDDEDVVPHTTTTSASTEGSKPVGPPPAREPRSRLPRSK